MANQEHLDLLKQGSSAWNTWRAQHQEVRPDLTQADLNGANLSSADLNGADLNGANLNGADLSGAVLSRAHLSSALLNGANLSRAVLNGAILNGAVLNGANLSRADLTQADLSGAVLSSAKLGEAYLIETDLSGATLSRAVLNGADLNGAYLSRAILSEAHLSRVDLSGQDLRDQNLSGADLSRAKLSGADLSGAKLSGADLSGANLSGADLSGANLSGADLSGANLSGANLSGANLMQAILVRTNFVQANLTNCRIYGISVWDVQLQDTKQSNLVITDKDQPTITVDNLKVAQFIYLLLNNQEIRDVIDTISKKVVLILGRFTPERKPFLDAIKEALRKHNYLPVLFDFEKPTSRDFTETVITLAHLSRFIIADLTDPSSIPQELHAIVPHCLVPVLPLLVEDDSKQEYAVFEDLRKRHHWILPTIRYQDSTSLLASLKKLVIEPAEQKARELEKR